MTIFKSILCLITIIISSVSAANSFPRGCDISGYGFSQGYLIVNNTGAQSFYLIQNRSNIVIELERYEEPEAFMSPPLTAKLDPLNWGAFASDMVNLNFQCFVKDNETKTRVDCANALDVCRYPRVKFALSNMGNYWVSINKTQHQVITEASQKGILLRW